MLLLLFVLLLIMQNEETLCWKTHNDWFFILLDGLLKFSDGLVSHTQCGVIDVCMVSLVFLG